MDVSGATNGATLKKSQITGRTIYTHLHHLHPYW